GPQEVALARDDPVGGLDVGGRRLLVLAEPGEQVAGALEVLGRPVEGQGAVELAGHLEGAGGGRAVAQLLQVDQGGVAGQPALEQDAGGESVVFQQPGVDEGGATVVAASGGGLGGLVVLADELLLDVEAAEPV